MAVHQVIGQWPRQPLVEGGEGLAAVLGAVDDHAAARGYAVLVLDLRNEPRPVRVGLVHHHGKAEIPRQDRPDPAPVSAGIVGAVDSVVMLQPHPVRGAPAAGQAVHVLGSGIPGILRRGVGGGHPLADIFPGGAVVRAVPDAAAGHRDSDVPGFFGVDQDGVDSRGIEASAHPAAAPWMVPEAFGQLPAVAVVVAAKETARRRSGPEPSSLGGMARFQAPDQLQRVGNCPAEEIHQGPLAFRPGRIFRYRDFLPPAAAVGGPVQLDAEMAVVQGGVQQPGNGVVQHGADVVPEKGRFLYLPGTVVPGDAEKPLACRHAQHRLLHR